MNVRGYVNAPGVMVGALIPPQLKKELVDLAYERRAPLSDVIRTALNKEVQRDHREAAA